MQIYIIQLHVIDHLNPLAFRKCGHRTLCITDKNKSVDFNKQKGTGLANLFLPFFRIFHDFFNYFLLKMDRYFFTCLSFLLIKINWNFFNL